MPKGSGENEVIEEKNEDTLFETEEGVKDETIQEPVEGEDAIETARRILEGNVDTEQETVTEASERNTDSVQDEVKPAKEAKQAKKSKTIEAPTYIEAADREHWSSLDDEARKIAKKVLDRQNARFMEKTREASEKIQESQAYRQHAEMYLNQHPELVERGYTGPKLLQDLLATHMILTGSDKKAAKARWEAIGRQAGFASVSTSEDGETTDSNVDISGHPEFQALQNQIKALTSDYEARRQQSEQQAVSSRMTEFQSIQAETDSAGNFIYPKFHDVEFVRQAKPLALGLTKTMSYADAWKAAYRALAPQDNFSQSNPAKFPAENNVKRNAANAAVSVRGRTSPQSANGFSDIPPEAIKPGMTAEETAAYIIRNRN